MRIAHGLALGSITFAVTAVIGCGVGDFDTLFSDGAGNGGAGGAGFTTSSSSNASSSGSTSTTTTSSSSSGSASSSTSSGSTTSSSSSSTSSSSSSSSTTSSSSSTSSSSTSGIPCGNGTVCPFGGNNACCWNNFLTAQPQAECVNAPADTDGCKTFAASDGYETRIECSKPSHCGAGQFCCANRQNTSTSSFYDTVTCRASCGWTDVILCDGPNFPCPMVQGPNGMVQTTCKTSMLLPPGYLVCGT